ncbi:hypothetical protein ACU61A_40920 [Pseudonocardia sichuanensis]
MTALTTADAATNPQPQAAAEFARSLGVRRRRAGAPVRTEFASDENVVARTPLARLLSGGDTGGGGRGGQLRVKLYLSLLWVCAKEPYNTIRPARAWAALLGLDDHEVRGVRRVQQALRDLHERGFIVLRDRGGTPPLVTLLDEHGDRSPYEPPSDTYSRLSSFNAPATNLARHTYFRVPTTIWTHGHIARLTGPSLAMLLVLLAERRGQDVPVWFSPERAQQRFSLSVGTRRAGLQHLRELGLLHSATRTVSEDGTYISFARRRRTHQLLLDPS